MITRFLIFLIPLIACIQSQENHIITIGDSHGAVNIGWVEQLKKLRPADSIMNFAISGNTSGFDNLGRESLNELRNIQQQLAAADQKFKKIDYIIVLLGTNDCKAVFDSLQDVVPKNLEKLISTIRNYKFTNASTPTIILATPPPIADDSMLEPKYHGGSKRLEKLFPYYKKLALQYHCEYVNCYQPLQKDFILLTKDGIHLTPEGYQKIATLISKKISK